MKRKSVQESYAPQILAKHFLHAQEFIAKKKELTRIPFLRLDRLAAAEIVRVENARNFRLNLTFGTLENVQHSLDLLATKNAPSHQRFIFRRNGGTHHIFADVHAEAGTPFSLILLEPGQHVSYLPHAHPHSVYAQLFLHLREKFPNARVSLIDMQTQKDTISCVMFCLFFALESYNHKKLFLNWHRAQHAGIPIEDPQRAGVISCHNIWGFQKNVWPCSILTADFIKHAQSKKTIYNYLEALPQDAVLARKMLSKKNLLLEERVNPIGKKNIRLTSLEYWRRDISFQTLNILLGTTYFSNVTVAQPNTKCKVSRCSKRKMIPQHLLPWRIHLIRKLSSFGYSIAQRIGLSFNQCFVLLEQPASPVF